ncbi:MAG: CehA/McbA family metallohydrolase, partial [Sphingomonadaceae bacterium]|nr:CehA/McbA family metallohydrolase [Sphingomonadaceae bacterium]
LSYGEFDARGARWSPDGRRIAYVSNEGGDGAIRILELPGAPSRPLAITSRRYLQPMGRLDLVIRDADGDPVPARVSIMASDGRAYAPDDAWIHADDSFDRADAPIEQRYFHADGQATAMLPPGPATITIWRGLEHSVETRTVEIAADATAELTVALAPRAPEGLDDWPSGDVHVHMNYGGAYRNTPARMVAQAEAEDLDIVFNTIVNKEVRIPDIGYFSTTPDPVSTDDTLLVPAQEFHTSFWGHLGLLGLSDHYLVPGYTAYPGTGLASLWPDNPAIAADARGQGALVGYVHPFDPGAEPNSYSTHAVPVDAALGNIDYYEVVGFADHFASAAIWHRLLNLGFRIAAAGGTDAMANYASLRGPVGINRTYVLPERGGGSLVERRDAWLAGLRAGRSMATNGPLLTLSVEGEGPGGVIARPAGGGRLRWRADMTSIAAVDHVEIVHNGEVVATAPIAADGRSARGEGEIEVSESGWILLRAWSAEDRPEILDTYPYATTSPVYVSVDGARPRSPEDAAYMLAWLELIERAAREGEYNDESERAEVLGNIARAREVYEGMR